MTPERKTELFAQLKSIATELKESQVNHIIAHESVNDTVSVVTVGATPLFQNYIITNLINNL